MEASLYLCFMMRSSPTSLLNPTVKKNINSDSKMYYFWLTLSKYGLPFDLPCFGMRRPFLPWRLNRQTAAIIKLHHMRAPILPINSGSWSRAKAPEWSGWEEPVLCGSEQKTQTSMRISSLLRWHHGALRWSCMSSLIRNPCASLGVPTPAPFTAATVIQYCFPGFKAEMSSFCWLLFTVQFW